VLQYSSTAFSFFSHILEPKVERHVTPVTFHNIVVDLHFSRMADQDEEEFYLKGYKVDRHKLLNNFPTRPDDPKTSDSWVFGNSFRQNSYTLQLAKSQKGESV
jgi:hypothetical protein